MGEYLFLASSFNKYAGPNNPLLDLCNYLYAKYKKTLVVVTNRGVVESDFLTEVQFPILRILEGSSPAERLMYTPSNVKTIRNLIARLLPRRIFVNSSIDAAFQTCFATNKQVLIGYNVFLNLPKLLLDRYFIRSVFFNISDRIASRVLVKKIVAHTLFHRKFYMGIGIEPSKISVIPHCVDLDRIHRALKSGHKVRKNDVPVVLFVGHLIPYKGIVELLRAYESVTRKIRVDLLIIGSGPLEKTMLEMKRLIERKNANANIIHIKRVSLSKLMCLMDSADVVAIPSHWEMFGMVALEAMALKKAVLATCFGGISEIITTEVNGILVNPFDSHQLQSRLEELVLDSNKRARLGSSAYQTIKNKYDVSIVAPIFVKFLEELA